MSKFGLAFELSPNTILAPLSIKALAVEGKVKEGIMTSSPGEIPAKIAKLAAERELCRVNEQFVQSDALRKEIAVLGYGIEDTPIGPFVYKK